MANCIICGEKADSGFAVHGECANGARTIKDWAVDNIRLALIKNIPLDRLTEICEAERDGRCVVLPCKVDDLINKCNKLTQPTGDQAETYTTGYENGHRNGQTELIAYLLQLDTGVRNEAEQALKGGAE